MTAGPQVSVVMPVLDQAAFVERAVRSVLAQQGPALELVVMDGGSSDGTQAVLAGLAREAAGRLRWVSETDSGPAHALNKAFALAGGEIIGWLNADDLYRPGAVQRAWEALQEHPDWWLVYGHAEHIDSCDRVTGAYPTRTPDAGTGAFADGCYICQPSVFLRRAMLERVGGLDQGLRAAFDLEWWLRLFSRYPDRVGFVDALQAASRLHPASITLGQRETVIRESMQVLACYLGSCPLHWFRTYTDELLTEYPHGPRVDNIKKHLQSFARSVRHCLSQSDRIMLDRLLAEDARLNLAGPDACLDLYADGWLPPSTTLRIRARRRAWRRVELRGRHVPQAAGPLSFEVRCGDGQVTRQRFDRPGPFVVNIGLPPAAQRPAYWSFAIDVQGGFVPSDKDPASDDHRKLACRIEEVRLCAR